MELFVIMLERLGIIVMVAFIMTRIPFFRRVVDDRSVTFSQKVSVTLLFGFFGIIGTYTGVVVSTGQASYMMWLSELAEDEAIVNARVIGIVVAGLLGGWKVGLGAGLIAGGHRFLLGGFTGFACGLSAIIAGLLAGFAHRYVDKGKNISLGVTFFVGALSETIQMGIILLVARPYEQAFALVEMIGLPMILANGVGAAVFVLIIRSVIREEEKLAAVQSGRALSIAEDTISFMRQGLTTASAGQTCQILLKEVGASAVSMTDQERILAYYGKGVDIYQAGGPIRTEATRHVLNQGEPYIGTQNRQDQTENLYPDIHAAMIVPLMEKDSVIGTLKFYFPTEKEITPLKRELILGLSRLLSNQLELARVEELRHLAQETEVKALQAQVSPHFLFNALNLIVSMIRTDPERARKLLLSLSHFFRQNLAGTNQTWSTLGQELKQIESYLEIQEARFQGELNVRWEVDDTLLNWQIPTLTMQPLIENAIKHGRKAAREPLDVTVRIERVAEAVRVTVWNNGRVIPHERLALLAKGPVHSEEGAGIGLYNVHKRLTEMRVSEEGLNIRSDDQAGTSISFLLHRISQTERKEGLG